jgi:hypothetical protein
MTDLISDTTVQAATQATAKTKETTPAVKTVQAASAQKKLEFPRKMILKNNATVPLTEPETGTFIYPLESSIVFIVSADVLTRAKTNIKQMDWLLNLEDCMSFEEEA